MPPTPPRKPQKPRSAAPAAYDLVPPERANAGKLFRVRDKDWDAVHGENLPWAEANKLKETVVGQGKSRTARLEDMTIPPPDWYLQQLAEIQGEDPLPVAPAAVADPQLAQMRAGALAASKQAAQAANARHAALDRSAPAGAKKVSRPAPVLAELPKVPVVSTIAAEDEDDEDFTVDPDLVGGLGAGLAEGQKDQPTKEDLARAKAKAAEDAKAAQVKLPAATPELTTRAKELYRRECALRGGGVPFDQLHDKVKANWRLEASKNPVDPPPVVVPVPEPEETPEPVAAADGVRNDDTAANGATSEHAS